MCDYSLMEVRNRLAEEGDDLVVHRFARGSIGLIGSENSAIAAKPDKSAGHRLWHAIKNFLQGGEVNQPVAVCVAPGARLLLADIPEEMQKTYRIRPVEEVTFTQLTAEAHACRDAIRLKSGAEILLQQLHEGQRVRVLQLTLPEHVPAGAFARVGSDF